ncbi:hypothetical protein HGRIS_004810 [Hohenbuehelia grisea]|uniref:DUF6534 domain-containing protein n=1 Tax=Hohenbuehelia grisea TaxID=104357 RepID=A0ABR3JDH9_9AGAR
MSTVRAVVPGIGSTGPLTGPIVSVSLALHLCAYRNSKHQALGYMLACILVGILIMQVYSYYLSFPKDRSSLKWTVGIIFFLELAFTLLTLINGYVSFGPGWGDPRSLEKQHWSFVSLAHLNGLIAMLVQWFFAFRVYKLSKRLELPLAVVLLSVLQCTMIFYVGTVNIVEGRKFNTLAGLSTEITVWLVATAACDILIVIGTVTILVRLRKDSRFTKTRTTLRRLAILSVETGFVTASAATIELILWQAQQSRDYHYIFFMMIGKLYSNAMLASLNSRVSLYDRGSVNDTEGDYESAPPHPTLFENEYAMSWGSRAALDSTKKKNMSATTVTTPAAVNVSRTITFRSEKPGETTTATSSDV